MRQRNKPWARDKIIANPKWVISNPQNNKGLWCEKFKNDNPIHIEIGTGKGKFIIEMAERNPHINFIGIEIMPNIIVSALDKCIDKNLPNVILLHAGAEDIGNYFALGEVECIYLNFSDPWGKTRHEKRRLTFAKFLNIYKEILQSEIGEIHLKTDNRKLFSYSLISFNNFGLKLLDVSLDLHDDNDKGNVTTEYEEKFSALGKPIYRLSASFYK